MEATSSGGLRMTSDLARDLYSLKMNNGLPLGLEHHVSQANNHPTHGNDSVDYRNGFYDQNDPFWPERPSLVQNELILPEKKPIRQK